MLPLVRNYLAPRLDEIKPDRVKLAGRFEGIEGAKVDFL